MLNNHALPQYRIKSDFTEQIVSRNHRCIIEREGKLLFQYVENLIQEQEICMPILETLQVLPETIFNLYKKTKIETSFIKNGMCSSQKSRRRRQSDRKFNVIQNKQESQKL